MLIFTSVLFAEAQNYIESYNTISDSVKGYVNDVKIIRPINGGSVVLPEFDNSCPEEMKAPFSYACKLFEEFLPPCLPLKVKVSCGRVNGSSSKSISKVLSRSHENFGESVYYNNAQMSVIKGVILGELNYNSTITYLDSIPNLDFLTAHPDIEITYNTQKLNELSFSLDSNPGEKYDFVSVALRDLLIGLGLSSSYRYLPQTSTLLNPAQEMTPFEDLIDEFLGRNSTPTSRLSKATGGELPLSDSSNPAFILYAPSTWQNGVSLNYFIPQENCCVSQILSYDFCKGMVTRSLADNYSNILFRDLLGWRPNFLTGSSTPSTSSGGSSSLVMPFNGPISFNDSPYGINVTVESEMKPNVKKMSLNNAKSELYSYVNSFHPFLYEGTSAPTEGISICVLKKDGTWDLVKYIPCIVEDMTFDMSDLTFHFDESQYARTADGYLRARITTKALRSATGTGIVYNSKFFVIDYLPQKVKLNYEILRENTRAVSAVQTVRVYFNDTEGLTGIILEKLRKGARLPNKIEITDLKKGFYDTPIEKTTTFTAVGYNKNGISRSVPVTVIPETPPLSELLKIRLEDNYLSVDFSNLDISELSCSIVELTPTLMSNCILKEEASEKVDISQLPKGIYMLVIKDEISGETISYKFKI